MRRWVSCFLVSEVKSVSEGAVCFGFLFILLRLKQYRRRAVCHAISFKLYRNGKKNGKRFSRLCFFGYLPSANLACVGKITVFDSILRST